MADQFDENGFIIPKRWQIRAGTLWESHHLTDLIVELSNVCTDEEKEFLGKMMKKHWYDWHEIVYRLFKSHENIVKWRAYHGCYKGSFDRHDKELAERKEQNKDFVQATIVKVE